MGNAVAQSVPLAPGDSVVAVFKAVLLGSMPVSSSSYIFFAATACGRVVFFFVFVWLVSQHVRLCQHCAHSDIQCAFWYTSATVAAGQRFNVRGVM
jgi:hypothetical protein